ncbi:hypothetical protein NKS28_01520 [Bacillus sp. 1663tsa1]|uniref:hypothetical protein n=1 Tax=Bacillus sp. 1663tsa1 TaxID=2953804 RepID=UPI0020A0F8A2|nr:hypothetical protein [Bacillus sp. 1663tsa1]MCP1176207.1 hypothetical protein [Bacillus sp. 1663tsa1]
MNNITGFQRMRRLQAEKEQENTKPLEVNEMSLEDVKKALDGLGVKYAHNAGLETLKGKLKDATK